MYLKLYLSKGKFIYINTYTYTVTIFENVFLHPLHSSSSRQKTGTIIFTNQLPIIRRSH